MMRLAANATGAGTLSAPNATLTLDNPTCGDRVTLQVRLEDGRIMELAHDNKACMLCQASASLLGEHAVGLTLEDIDRVRAALLALLEKGEEQDGDIDLPWEGLEFFAPVKDHKSRHICVLLPFNALIEILETQTEQQE
nr:iron-sulfur cluster assembly scaffold protein [Sneathiella chinensis]